MNRGKLKDEDYNIIVRNFVWLKEQIEARHIVDYLFQHEVLTLNDKQKILIGANQDERIDTLLTIILHAGPYTAFEIFLRSLSKKYQHVEQKLRQSAKQNSPSDIRSRKLMEEIKHLNKDHNVEKQRLQADRESLRLKPDREIQKLNEKIAELEKKHSNENKILSKSIESLEKENENLKSEIMSMRHTLGNKSSSKTSMGSESNMEHIDIYLDEDIELVKQKIEKFKLDVEKI